MAIVLTNGQYYIKFSDSGAVKKTLNIHEARKFYNVNVASRKLLEKMEKSPTKCEGYYVFDTEGDEHALNTPKKVKKRKYYTADVRKMIYDKADGRCVLCGRKIVYKDMTLDHVIPLAMGGADEVENLACTCFTCNQFKGSILPDTFIERISQIFLYQMEKKHCNNWKWKIIRKMLLKLSVEK